MIEPESRSMQKRKAAQRGEPMPTFSSTKGAHMKENELVEQLVSAITNNDKEFSFGHQQIREALQEYGLAHIRSCAATERAGMREACAKELNTELESIKDEDAEVRAIQRLLKVRTRIRSLSDKAADEAIERVKAAARLEEAKWWRHLVIMRDESYFAVEGDKRIAELTAAAKETP